MHKNIVNIQYFIVLFLFAFVNLSHSGQITNCEFVHFNIYHVRLSCDHFNGTHEPLECFHAYFKNKYLKDKVQILETGDCRGSRLNSSLSDFFRSLQTYDIFYHGVEHLSAADLNFRNLQKLNASHNELVTIFGTTFDNTPNMIEIIFSFNKIVILEKGAFSRLAHLEILDLKNNLIESIDENMFKYNNNLKKLVLEENPLKRLDGNIFWPFLNSTSVYISYDHLKELDTSCLKETMYIEIQKKNVILSTIASNYKLNFPIDVFKNLTHFNISGNQLQNTSQLIELLGPSVKEMDLNSNFLGKPKSKTFKFTQILNLFYNLSYLSLSDMNLTDATFNATHSKLELLDLSKNRLNSLNFTGIFENLEILDVSRNNLTEIPSSIFNFIPNAVEINLSHNQISVFANDTFSHLELMQFLDLSGNLIQSIDGKLFENNKKLTTLRLENNLITRIDCNMFDLLQKSAGVNKKSQGNDHQLEKIEENWKNLIEIDLSCMKNALKMDLDDMNGVTFRRNDGSGFHCSKEMLRNLKYLNISGLHIENTTKLLQFLGESLESLDVSSNFIGPLNVQTFEKLTNLKILNLSRTNLSNFGFETFYHQKKLFTLDLSFNQLKKLNFTLLFRNFKNLKTLNLENDDLTEVDTVTKLIFPNLASLAISKNHFSCDYLATFLFQWHNLHLMNNPSNQTNIDGVDCYHNPKNFDNVRHSQASTKEPETRQTPNATTEIELVLEDTSTELEKVEKHTKIYENEVTQTETHTQTNNSVNNTNQPTDYYLLELRIFEGALVVFVLCTILSVAISKCKRVKRKMRCNSRTRNRHDGRNSQHNIELIEHETFDY